jgi:lactate dehydrogenase-like 2-hydroxyacid dehydrogenase
MAPVPRPLIKLAILDDYQGIAAPHFDALKPNFEITVFRDTLLPYNHPNTPSHVQTQLVDRLKPYTIISSMRERTPFPAPLLQKLPNLKLLLTTGHRNAAIDMQACKELGIKVTGASGSGRINPRPGGRSGQSDVAPKKKKGPDSTTQHTVALILGIARNLATDNTSISEGGWQTGLATGLSGKVFGTLGLGRLGVNVAKIMHVAFGMRILAWSSSLNQDTADEKAKEAGLPVQDEDGEKTFKVVTKDELFKEADVVSVHYVLSDRSRGLISLPSLSLMKPSALFINTSRGPLVVESDLLQVLEEGKIRGAALDVFELEPLPEDSKWRTTKWGTEGRASVLSSPHMGYVEEETMGNWYEEQVEIVERWWRGEELLQVLA